MADYLCIYIVTDDYLCVYKLMDDYLRVYILMDDYLCVYILMDDYFDYMFKERKKRFICFICLHDTFLELKNIQKWVLQK